MRPKTAHNPRAKRFIRLVYVHMYMLIIVIISFYKAGRHHLSVCEQVEDVIQRVFAN